MTTKLTLLTALAVLLCTGCLDKAADRAAGAVQVPVIEAMADYQIPVQPGMATIVELEGQTLAVTRESATISVPRYAVESGLLEVSYSAEDIYNEVGSAEWWQYISFEDTRKGDYDYNDLVIHCRIRTSGAGYDGENKKMREKHEISVQPVALGGSLKLRLGILYKETADATELKEAILCNDVRKELFGGNASFPINTDSNKEIKRVSTVLTPFFEVTNYDLDFKVVWFIENQNGDRLYAATTNFGADKTLDMISPDGLPYGISFTKKWDYPVEKCPINEAYPGFAEWLRTGRQDVLLATYVKANVFPASINKLWDYDR